MSGGKYPLKVALAVLGLLGALAFTFSRILGDSIPEKSGEASASPREPSREKGREPAAESAAPASKALRWEDYLSFDPFQGRGQPNAKLYALAERPSPFFSETAGTEVEIRSTVPEILQRLELSAILGDPGQRIAVISGKTYRSGDHLLEEDGRRLEDRESGSLRIARIDRDKVTIQAGGTLFPLELPEENRDYIRSEGKKAPKLEEKKDD